MISTCNNSCYRFIDTRFLPVTVIYGVKRVALIVSLKFAAREKLDRTNAKELGGAIKNSSRESSATS